MRAQNSDDVFYITYSKWKVWVYTVLCWVIASGPLLLIFILAGPVWAEEKVIETGTIIGLAFFGLLFLLFASIPFMLLAKLNKPVVTLTRNGFCGFRNFKRINCAWTQNTVIYRGNKNIILANIDPKQNLWSKLWGGPKAAIVLSNVFMKQSRQDILEAINRLPPYPVKQTTMLKAAIE